MARLEFKGIDEYVKKMNQLEQATTPILKKAVYEGVDEIADAMRTEIQALQNIDPVRKQGLLDGLGTSKIVDDKGVVNAKIGFNGYNGNVSAKFPKGEPNALIARSIVKGLRGKPKKDFVKKAVRNAKGPAEERMKILIIAEIEEKTKGM